jgi:hypothetical protein
VTNGSDKDFVWLLFFRLGGKSDFVVQYMADNFSVTKTSKLQDVMIKTYMA